jgi:hypothetical protein
MCEWLTYTFEVFSDMVIDIVVRTASQSKKSFGIEIDGALGVGLDCV